MPVTEGRFGERVMQRAMLDAAGQIGAVADDAQLLRLTNNAVYALPGERLVIRITPNAKIVRTDRRGRFSVTLPKPPADQMIAVYRLRTTSGGKTYTLPLVLRTP